MYLSRVNEQPRSPWKKKIAMDILQKELKRKYVQLVAISQREEKGIRHKERQRQRDSEVVLPSSLILWMTTEIKTC